jgi:ArsR family transcriptional regulator, arsenate/arsenite/antimonite-responsive transcriptional repressor
MTMLAAAGPLSRLFAALEDETRLRIVALLSHRELCVCHIQQILGLSQPTISRHLRLLRLANVVTDRRVGRWVHYRLASQVDPDCARIMRPLIRSFSADRSLKVRIRTTLAKAGTTACAP